MASEEIIQATNYGSLTQKSQNQTQLNSPLIQKFKLLLKQKGARWPSDDDTDDDYSASSGYINLSNDEFLQLYEVVLQELTFNSKPVITDLTIIANRFRDYAAGISDSICARIIEVPVEQKLPSLYLLDSIVKNLGRDYVRHFSPRLPEVFCEAYRQVHPSLHNSMRHLFKTWSTVFPPAVLSKIESQLQFSSQVNNTSSSQSSVKASDSPRTSIHVNPKYVRLEHPVSENVGAQRLNTMESIGPSFAVGPNKLHPSSSSRLARRLSPSRIGAERPLPPEFDDFSTGNLVDGASPSHPVFDYRTIVRDEEANERRRKPYSDDSHSRYEASAVYSLANGHELQGPRALIDAYGEDKRKRIPNSKPLQIERLDVDGTVSKVSLRSWQNTEEEEFDWEDMNQTLTDRSRSNDLLTSAPPFRGAGAGAAFGKRATSQLDSDIRNIRSGQTQLPSVDDSSNINEDTVSSLGTGHGGSILGFQSDRSQIMASQYPRESLRLPHHFSQAPDLLNANGRRDFQMLYNGSGIPSSRSEILGPIVDKISDADAQIVRPSNLPSRIGSSAAPSSTGAWLLPNAHKSHPLPPHNVFPPQKQSRSQLDPRNASNTALNQGLLKPSFSSELQLNGIESKEHSLLSQSLLPGQHATLNQQSQAQVNPFQPRFLPLNEARENFPPSLASVTPHSLIPHFDNRYATQGSAISVAPSNLVHTMQLPLLNNIPNVMHLQGGLRPPLPPGPPPASHTSIPQNVGTVVSNQPSGSAFSGLITSLMAQGLISLNQSSEQDSVGLEFNADLLKVRHESAITALYADLPRQCTTCGLRFKCKEEHSNHMDWHVTKNRTYKNRKQKPSRKWFVSASMWLSGAEALGTDAVPGFLPTEAVVEKKDDEELAVPADEEQNACALCGEPFDDFYSDETEEWMYKGAVYLNAPSGSTAGMDKSQLGPIVHAKCRPESSVVPSEDIRSDEGANMEDASHRKRLRS